MGCDAEDSIEHYAHCPCIGAFSRRGLGLDRAGGDRMADFLVLNLPAQRVAEPRARRAVMRLAAVYIAYCRWRHLRARDALQVDALLQVLRELMGSPQLMDLG